MIIRTSTGYDATAQRIVEGTVPDMRSGAARIQISDLVARFAASGGKIRIFGQGDSGEYIHVQNFLATRGYTLSGCGRARLYVVRSHGQKGPSKKLSWTGVVNFVDGIRAGEGLEPLKRRVA